MTLGWMLGTSESQVDGNAPKHFQLLALVLKGVPVTGRGGP
jgi:hypothetical protein